MPFTSCNSLNVFLSYASEDQPIADALAGTMRDAFDDKIEITMMSEFQTGLNWRNIIDSSIEKADMLIAIATGQLKPGHSFTGYEIGSFSQSKRGKSNMDFCSRLERRIIPFAILDRTPDTIREFEGVNINPGDLYGIRFDAANLEREIGTLSIEGRDKSTQNAFKFLCDIQDVISEGSFGSGSDSGFHTVKAQKKIDRMKQLCYNLCVIIFQNIANKQKSESYPKSKVVIRLEPDRVSDGDVVSGATLRIQGSCYDAFGLESSAKNFDWQTFTKKVDGEDISYLWNNSFNSLLRGDHEDGFIENNMIISFDRTKLFRLFVSKVTTFYSGAKEYDVYVIRLLKPKDYGNPQTTLLLKALQVSLGYSFMFLESTSEFSPDMMRAVKVSEFRSKVVKLKNSLDLLLQLSEDAGLNETDSIVSILGREAVRSSIDELYTTWETQKRKLDRCCRQMMIGELDLTAKLDFIDHLEDFCNNTRSMNKDYTRRVLSLLQDKVETNRAPVPEINSQIKTSKNLSSKKAGLVTPNDRIAPARRQIS